jgi:optic atrophy protein 1
VVFFWRLKRMIEITSNAIRQQISNIESTSRFCSLQLHSLFALLSARRLEREVKDILDDFSADDTLKSNLLKGKRVDLAEDLSKCSSLEPE